MSQRRNRSPRAQARAIMNQQRAVLPAPSLRPHIAAPSFVFDLPDSSPPSLIERARALYEDSVVPVHEIARLCGVSERTIYKYAHRQNWKPRYRWDAHDLAKWRPGWSDGHAARGDSGRAGARHRGWQPEPAFAPAKGAGARFIRREEAGGSIAVGLMANDPAAAAQAASACEAALALSASAERKAAFLREMERREKACHAATSLLRQALALAGPPGREGVSRAHRRSRKRAVEGCLRLAVRQWEMALDDLTEHPHKVPQPTR